MNWSDIWTFISPVYTVVVTAALAYVGTQFKRVRDSSRAEREALGALLRNDMFAIYEEYRDSDEVPIRYQEEMESLYRAYSGLGFNNTGTKIHDEIMAKKTKL